jgi:hypothetical protein
MTEGFDNFARRRAEKLQNRKMLAEENQARMADSKERDGKVCHR